MSQSQYGKRFPLPLVLTNALSLVGLGVSVYLTQHFYEVRNGSAGFKSFCNLGETMNCDAVAASSYADVLLGIPISSYSAGWFLSLFLIAIVAYNPFWRREGIRALFGLSFLGVVVSTAFFLIMQFQLKTYCLLCLVIDGLALGIFALTLILRPEGFTPHKPKWSQWKVLLGLSAGCLFASLLGLSSLNDFNAKQSDIEEVAQSILNSPVIPVKSGDEFPSMGPANAPITIVEFSDFQCPFCRIAAFSIHSVLNRYPTQVRMVFRNFPLDQACNPLVQHTAHPVACEAAKVAVCAHQQGRFKPVYEELFEKQSSYRPGVPLEIAKKVGLPESQTQGCIQSPETASAISRDIDEGKLLGVQSTPTFFINGHKAEGALPPAVWSHMIEKLLKK